jgi:putative glutamine amidotransferase
MPARPAHPADTWRAPKPDADAPPWRPGPSRPVIGITTDIADPAPEGAPPKLRATLSLTYIRAVTAAGGLPVLLPPVLELAYEFARRCDAFVFTGGDDPRTEPFGEPTHPKATPVHPDRQAFEIALLDELLRRPAAPVLGVCLGMQMMALHAGGALHQHMPDVLPTAEDHRHDATHPIKTVIEPHPVIEPGAVTSHHRQAVRAPGRLRVVAVAPDGVIEAIDDPARPFYVGVQWHPERTAFEPLGATIFARLVQAARADR